MTPEAYQLALESRGFTYNAARDVWVGPYNVQANGPLGRRTETRGPERDVSNQFARAAIIGQIDEQLRAKRGLNRDPLVEPVNEFSPRFTPYVQISPPGTSPPHPVYPPHQENLPDDGTRIT